MLQEHYGRDASEPGVARRCLAGVVFHIVKLCEGLPHDHKLWADRAINNKKATDRLQFLISSGFQDNTLAMEANLCATTLRLAPFHASVEGPSGKAHTRSG